MVPVGMVNSPFHGELVVRLRVLSLIGLQLVHEVDEMLPVLLVSAVVSEVRDSECTLFNSPAHELGVHHLLSVEMVLRLQAANA